MSGYYTSASVLFTPGTRAVAAFKQLQSAGLTDYKTLNQLDVLFNELNRIGLINKNDITGAGDKIKALWLFLSTSSGTQKFNILRPTSNTSDYCLTFNGGITHGSNGADWNGTTGYASSNLNPNTVLSSKNSNHIMYWSRENITENTVDMGYYLFGAASLDIELFAGTFYAHNCGNGGSAYISAATGMDGMFINSRTASNAWYIGKNGSSLATSTSTAGSLPNSALRIGSNAGSPNYYSTKACRAASIGDGITTSEFSSYYTALNNFFTALGI